MDKVILVTGANRGIGFEIARQCGNLGFHVILSGRDNVRLQSSLSILRDQGINADPILMDVGDQSSISTAVKEIELKNLKIDVLVNNAGIGIRGDRNLLHDDESILLKALKTNSYGPFYVTKSFLPLMNHPGRVIMISSSGGVLNGPVPDWSPAYCISKTLLNAFTKRIAYELKSVNIAVNAVCPGWVKTDMGGAGATRSVEKGAETPVWLATEAPQSLTCKFLRDKKEISW